VVILQALVAWLLVSTVLALVLGPVIGWARGREAWSNPPPGSHPDDGRPRCRGGWHIHRKPCLMVSSTDERLGTDDQGRRGRSPGSPAVPKARAASMVRLGGVDEKWVAQIDGTGASGGIRQLAVFGGGHEL